MKRKKSIMKRMYGRTKSFTKRAVGVDNLKPAAAFIMSTLNQVIQSFHSAKNTQDPISFEEALTEFQMSEEEINKKQKQLLVNCILFALFGTAIFFFACLRIKQLSMMTLVNYFLAAFVMYIFAFRMHFYRFLIIKRRLDLKVRDWVKALMGGEI